MNPQMMIAIKAKADTKPVFDQVVADAGRVNTALVATGGRAATAMTGAGGATANLAAQLNDIGVMLASGQSPLLLAVQQGSQITQVFAGMSGGQALGALKTAFLSLINPISLVTIGTIAAGAALFQYVTSLNTDGRDSTEVIKEQDDLIKKVAESWGAAVPSLKAYVDQLDRATEAQDRQATKQAFAAAQFREADASINEMMTRLPGLAQTLMDVGESGAAIQELRAAFGNLDAEIAKGTATSEDAERANRALSAVMSGPGAAAVKEFAAGFPALIRLVAAAAAETARLNVQIAAVGNQVDVGDTYRDRQEAQFQFLTEQQRVIGLTEEQLALEREMERVRGDAKSAGAVLTESQILSLAEQRVAREKELADLRSDGKAGARAADAAIKERDAVKELIAELEHEQSLIGMSNVEKEVANALREAGAAATDTQRQRIEELIVATNAADEAQKAATKGWEDYGKIGQGAVRGIVDILKDGKVEANEWADLLGRIGDQFIDLALNGLFSAFKPGGGGGGFLGGLFGFSEGGGGVVGGAGSYVKGAADNTVFMARAQKGEPFAFGQAAIDGLGGGGATVAGPSISITIDARGAERGAGPNIAREVRKVLPDAIELYNRNNLRRNVS